MADCVPLGIGSGSRSRKIAERVNDLEVFGQVRDDLLAGFYAAAHKKHRFDSVKKFDLVDGDSKAGKIHVAQVWKHLCYWLAPP